MKRGQVESRDVDTTLVNPGAGGTFWITTNTPYMNSCCWTTTIPFCDNYPFVTPTKPKNDRLHNLFVNEHVLLLIALSLDGTHYMQYDGHNVQRIVVKKDRYLRVDIMTALFPHPIYWW